MKRAHKVGASETFASFETIGTPIRPFNALSAHFSSIPGKGMRFSKSIEQFPSVTSVVGVVHFRVVSALLLCSTRLTGSQSFKECSAVHDDTHKTG